MEEYELETQIFTFCCMRDKETRYNEITKSIFKDKRIIDILKELAEDEREPSRRQNYFDHIELFVEYQTKGIVALNFFTSIIEVESSFTQFAFGFDDFPKRKKYLLSVPFLMEKRSIDIITEYINREKYLSNNMASRLFRNLLKACRVIGVEEAFIEFATPDEKYVDAVNELMKRDSIPGFLLFINDYKEIISSREFRTVFHYLQAQYEKEKSKRDRILAFWDVISSHQSNNRVIWYWEDQ